MKSQNKYVNANLTHHQRLMTLEFLDRALASMRKWARICNPTVAGRDVVNMVITCALPFDCIRRGNKEGAYKY